jgi:hypothetical protein
LRRSGRAAVLSARREPGHDSLRTSLSYVSAM